MGNNYEDFKKEVLKLTGIDLNAYKERQMKRRIDTLIGRNGFTGYVDYTKLISTDAQKLDEFVNYLTINVSEFYRNPALWDTLEQSVLPKLIEQYGSNLKIWSAACSTGDEPYTIAMILAKKMPLNRIHILATDLDEQVIEKAKIGVYGPNSLKGLPDEYKKKYFEQMGEKAYKISDDIKRCVEFKKHNLLKDPYPSGCHLIVCRNVMIYFTEEAKDQIYRKLTMPLLRADAFLLVIQSRLLITRNLALALRSCFSITNCKNLSEKRAYHMHHIRILAVIAVAKSVIQFKIHFFI